MLLFNQISASAVSGLYFESASYLTFSKPSQSGFSDIVWVDENGKEIKKDYQNKSVKKGAFSAKSDLPNKYNSAEHSVVTPVKNQGITGSCWAFSMISIAESSLLSSKKANINSLDLSEAHHVWFTHKSYVEKNDTDSTSGDGTDVSSPYQSGGNWLRSTFSLARGMGYANESDYPFSPNDEKLMGNYPETSRYVSNYRLKNSYTIPKDDTTAIKEKIMSCGAVGVSIYMNSSYLNKTVGNYCYYYPTNKSTNHQVTIVGWDDEYSSNNFNASYRPEGNGAWIVKNSYGSSWGNDGYFYLSYYDKTIAYINAVDVVESTDISSVYQYDGYGYSTSVLSSDASGNEIKTASFANVFKANKTENVSSVSFYTTGGKCDYKVEIYTGLSNSYSNPTQDAKLVSTQTGSVSYDGYHTVELTDYAKVTKDEYFSVVVTVTCENGASIVFEGQSNVDDGSYIRYYSSSSRQSYYRFGTSSSWKESSGTTKNNVCVKAFTSEIETIEIKTANDLKNLSKAVSEGDTFKGKTVKLMNDISMPDSFFEPIGTAEYNFEGIFDGNGKVIRYLNVNKTQNAGFFGVTGKSSIIKYLGLEGVSVIGKNNTGALAGISNSSKIYNCYVTGSVTGGDENTGGLFGVNDSVLTDNCYCAATVSGEKGFGTIAGLDNSSYSNCYALSENNPVFGKESVTGIILCTSKQFKNGYVAYNLKSDVLTWTKGEEHPVLSQSEDDAVHMPTIYNKNTSKMLHVYLTQYEDIYDILADEFPTSRIVVYSDYQAVTEFSGPVTFNRMLYIRLSEMTFDLKAESSYSIYNGCLIGVKQFTSALDILSNFKNENELSIYDTSGRKVSDNEYVGTGYSVKLKNRNEETIGTLSIVIAGDLNSDGFVDAFDLSIMSAAANFEIDLETNKALFSAGDLEQDGFIDTFDVSILTAAVNFEIEL